MPDPVLPPVVPPAAASAAPPVVVPPPEAPKAPEPRQPSRALQASREMQKQDAIFKREQALKQESAQIETRRKEIETRATELAQRDEALRRDPAAMLKHYGYTPEQIAAIQGNGGKLPVDQRIAQLERELAASQQRFDDTRKQDIEERKTAAQREAETLERQFIETTVKSVQSSADKYPFTARLPEGPATVVNVMREAIRQGRDLTESEACALVEEYYAREFEEVAQKHPKFAAKFAPAPQTQTPPATPSPAAIPTRTLGTSATASATPAAEQRRPLRTEDDYVKAGLAALDRLDAQRKQPGR